MVKGEEIYVGDLLKDPQGNIGEVFYLAPSFAIRWKRRDGSWDTDCCFWLWRNHRHRYGEQRTIGGGMKKYQIIYADPPWQYGKGWGWVLESIIL